MSDTLATTIDLRQIEPYARHTLIFSSYAALLPGATTAPCTRWRA